MEYAITGIAGIFPGARNIGEYWDNILNAKVASATSMEKIWGIPRRKYMDFNDIKKSMIYNDLGFCLPDDMEFLTLADSGRQVSVAKEVVKEIFRQLKEQSNDFNFSKTGLVLGTSWTDVDYFNKDIELMLGKSPTDIRGDIYTSDKQISAIADSLGIGGPCFAVDAACASSLYALDSGMGLIKNGLADSAIIMGLNVSIPYFLYVGFSKLNALSFNNEIIPFSKDASGIMLGEGAGAVMVEPIEKAQEAGHKILAVIKSIGLSSDGEERSPFAPGYNGQIAALSRAYSNLEEINVNYIEAHGTATKIGDETELKALTDFFGNLKHGKQIPLGSVKSLIGHGLAASGIASIIKAVLIINRGIIPPHIPVQSNTLLENACLYLPDKAKKINNDCLEINVGISSFGFGGANSHLVLSSFSKSEYKNISIKPSKDNNEANILKEPLAILDFGYDSSNDTESLPVFDSSRFTQFPFNRFQLVNDLNYLEKDNVIGNFFPDSVTIEALGLKMGPNALKKIDPFQALVIHTINVMLSRNDFLKNTKDTGIVLCNNISGLMSLRQFRRVYFLLNKEKIDGLELSEEMNSFLKSEVSFEEITSTIPAMLSGYPARHFNIQGFHQTISGGETTFLQLLLMAQYWLEAHCKNLIIGAGHIIKSPADIMSYQKNANVLPPIYEGFSAFILKKISDIKESDKDILGYIPAIILGSNVNNFEGACKAAKIDPVSVKTVETCQVNLSALSKDFSESENTSKLLSVYMAEATGTIEFMRLLKSNSKMSCLQFMDNDKLIAAVFFVKEKGFKAEGYKIQLPTEICFSTPKKVKKENPIIIKSETSDLDSNRKKPNLSIEEISLVHDNISSIVLNYLEHQKKLIQALSKSKTNISTRDNVLITENNIEKCFRDLYINPQNIVISNIRFNITKESCESLLVVDQRHNYFFDHELDHVPGFLILEGILQLNKIYVISRLNLQNFDEYYINSLVINFNRFCEKDSPISLKLKELTNDAGNGLILECEVIQNENVICSATVGVRKLNSKLISEMSRIHDISLANQKYVHKVDKRNIVVEDVEVDKETEKSTCRSIIPPYDHVLYDGNGKAASILYLLEVTRQFLAQISHKFGVSFDMQQILISMNIQVKQPIDKRSTLYIECEKQKTIKLNDTLLSNLKTTIKCNDMIIAETIYKAQAVSKDVYNKLRWKKSK